MTVATMTASGISLAGAPADVLHRRLLWATLLLAAIVFYWGLGDIALMSFNEARRAIPAGNMFASGDWLLPRINGELYLSKPPLLYWLSAGFAHLFGGANEWAVRLPSALAAGAIAWAAYRYALRLFGAWPALFTLQLLVANAGFAMFARRAEIEMLLTALCSGALLAALHYACGAGDKRWLRLSYLLLGLALLTKGPLALLFVTLPLLAIGLYRREARYWDTLRDPWGWAICLVVGLSWYAAVTWQLGFHTWQAIVHKDMVNKMHGAAAEPFYNYVLWLTSDFFPASLLLLVRPRATWQRWKGQRDTVTLLLAVALPFVIYTLFSDKHAKYLLPIYPLLAMLLGLRLGELLEHAGAHMRKLLLGLGVLLPVLYAGYFAFGEARLYDYRISAFPQFAAWARSAPDVPLYGYKSLDERLLYYARHDIPLLQPADLQRLRGEHKPMLLLVESAHIDAVAPLADCKVHDFTPYLKRNKTLVVFGFGAACATTVAQR